MSLIRATALAAALLACAGATKAAQQCGATTHSTFGETRAYFQNSLGACRPDGYCSVVLALTPPNDPHDYAQTLRIARPTPGAPHEVSLVSVVPSATEDGQPMSVSFGRRPIDLVGMTEFRDNTVNEFHVTDRAAIDAIVSGARRSNGMRWSYQSEAGPADAWFALGGVTRALNWIDCMGRR
ncbi:hypothetical protein [Brevundimonas aurifodinae]|uniref:Lipoprotein n=2 Tax=Brevundimonas TaxID=41275 RepID=A0ABV1NLU3_9CAUL|nr:MAG: hypothetical protein B7Z42_04865 [Brevundimonas sp. 12-68-7]OYX36127.1 MAG: hypothetical protein B7Z01_00280 [Brevundimonas subvibrioides]